MQQDEQRIMPGAAFDGTAGTQAGFVAAGIDQLSQTLHRHQQCHDLYPAQDHPQSSKAKPAQKPGPMALSIQRPVICRRFSASTNSTVTADMLP